jgi:S-DNA-T family DNA segregation ATPase FtsK/SpoIIIE
MYLFPIGLAAIGLWLCCATRSVPLAPERLVGLLLLFLNLLTWLHLFFRPADACPGGGGGTLGAFFYQISMLNLGLAGTLVLLLAWLLLALALSLDISVVDLFRWMPRLVEHVQDGVQDWLDERRNRYGPLPTPTPGLSRSSMPPVDKAAPAISAASLAPPGQPRPWVLPSLQGVLDPGSDVAYDDDYDRSRARVIEETLKAFGAPVNVVEINRGPVITQFGVEPAFIETRNGRMRVRVGKIASLVDDLALALSARTIRVQAPVPGKGYVGIEVPNTEIATVALRE